MSFDLTVDGKFTKEIQLPTFLKDNTRIQWKDVVTPNINRRIKDDYYSSEFGTIIRRTTDNHFMFFSKPKYKHFNLIFREFIEEECGGLRGHVIYICPVCGRKIIRKSFMDSICYKCREDKIQKDIKDKLFTKRRIQNGI